MLLYYSQQRVGIPQLGTTGGSWAHYTKWDARWEKDKCYIISNLHVKSKTLNSEKTEHNGEEAGNGEWLVQ